MKIENCLSRILCVQNQDLLAYRNNLQLLQLPPPRCPCLLVHTVEKITLQCVFSVSASVEVLIVLLTVHLLCNCLGYQLKVLEYHI